MPEKEFSCTNEKLSLLDRPKSLQTPIDFNMGGAPAQRIDLQKHLNGCWPGKYGLSHN